MKTYKNTIEYHMYDNIVNSKDFNPQTNDSQLIKLHLFKFLLIFCGFWSWCHVDELKIKNALNDTNTLH